MNSSYWLQIICGSTPSMTPASISNLATHQSDIKDLNNDHSDAEEVSIEYQPRDNLHSSSESPPETIQVEEKVVKLHDIEVAESVLSSSSTTLDGALSAVSSKDSEMTIKTSTTDTTCTSSNLPSTTLDTDEHLTLFQRYAISIAKNPTKHLFVALTSSLILTIIAITLGDFAITLSHEGLRTRGTKYQSYLISFFIFLCSNIVFA